MAKKSPRPADVAIGAKIKKRRMMLGMSQEKLGEALGITFQQVQKYEKGTNRVGGSRMVEIAKVLGVPIAHLFEGASNDAEAVAPPTALDAATIDVVRLMNSAPPEIRPAIRDMAETLVKANERLVESLRAVQETRAAA
jgi:transcriptional regulator with XRE-family HTH domain